MSDPFQVVDSGGAEIVRAIGDALDVRAAEPIVQAIVGEYHRRIYTNTLYGFLPFAIMIADC